MLSVVTTEEVLGYIFLIIALVFLVAPAIVGLIGIAVNSQKHTPPQTFPPSSNY